MIHAERSTEQEEALARQQLGMLQEIFIYAANNSVGARKQYFTERLATLRANMDSKYIIPFEINAFETDNPLEFTDNGSKIEVTKIKRRPFEL